MKTMEQAIEFLQLNGFNVAKPPRPSVSIQNAEYLFNGVMTRLIEKNGQTLVQFPQHREVIEWLSDNKGQGLILMGNCGNGKSLIAMQALPIIIYMTSDRLVGCYHIRQLKEKWSDVIKRKIIVVDDIGIEEKVNEFGNKRDLLMELVNICEEENKLLIVTTNFTGKELIEKYDDRTYSRLVGMCRPIFFTNEDLRIKNKNAK